MGTQVWRSAPIRRGRPQFRLGVGNLRPWQRIDEPRREHRVWQRSQAGAASRRAPCAHQHKTGACGILDYVQPCGARHSSRLPGRLQDTCDRRQVSIGCEFPIEHDGSPAAGRLARLSSRHGTPSCTCQQAIDSGRTDKHPRQQEQPQPHCRDRPYESCSRCHTCPIPCQMESAPLLAAGLSPARRGPPGEKPDYVVARALRTGLAPSPNPDARLSRTTHRMAG